MTDWTVRLGVIITPDGEPGDDIDTFTTSMYEELLALSDGADMDGSVESGRFFFTVTVQAHDFEDAVHQTVVLVQCAGHAAGGNTSSFPSKADEWPAWLRQLSVEASVVDEDCLALA